jgi:hypothetical protein
MNKTLGLMIFPLWENSSQVFLNKLQSMTLEPCNLTFPVILYQCMFCCLLFCSFLAFFLRQQRESIRVKTNLIISVMSVFLIAKILYHIITLELLNIWIMSLLLFFLVIYNTIMIHFPREERQSLFEHRLNIQNTVMRREITTIRNELNQSYVYSFLYYISSVVFILNFLQILFLNLGRSIQLLLIYIYYIFYNKGKASTISGAFSDKGQRVTIICILMWYHSVIPQSLLWIKVFIFCFETDYGFRGQIHKFATLVSGFICVLCDNRNNTTDCMFLTISLEKTIHLNEYINSIPISVLNLIVFLLWNEYSKFVNTRYKLALERRFPNDRTFEESGIIVMRRNFPYYDNILSYHELAWLFDLSFINESLLM